MAIDRKAFRSLSSGLYVVSSLAEDGLKCGCVVNTLLQVASEPAQLLVSVNKRNATADAILSSGRFCASVLSQDTTMELIGTFGFKTSTEVDKFAEVEYVDYGDIPCLSEDALATFEVRVDTVVDAVTHFVFVGTVISADVHEAGTPLTYDYYHRVLRGKTPEKAASFNEGDDPSRDEAPASSADDAPSTEEGRAGWRCMICGHIVEGYPDGLPEDFRCPVCGMGRECFERIEL